MKNRSYIFDCQTCETRCDDKSLLNYNFENDVKFSEQFETIFIETINKKDDYSAKKSEQKEFPDIEIVKNGITTYAEIKVQTRTFMKIGQYLPNSVLSASETVALNLSDLQRYFELSENNGLNIYVFWFLANRNCIVKQGKYKIYYQHIGKLKEIYERTSKLRIFRRKTGEGDVVDGVHKGVTVNFHFSLSELIPFSLQRF